jgi:hypothetical protein
MGLKRPGERGGRWRGGRRGSKVSRRLYPPSAHTARARPRGGSEKKGGEHEGCVVVVAGDLEKCRSLSLLSSRVGSDRGGRMTFSCSRPFCACGAPRFFRGVFWGGGSRAERERESGNCFRKSRAMSVRARPSSPLVREKKGGRAAPEGKGVCVCVFCCGGWGDKERTTQHARALRACPPLVVGAVDHFLWMSRHNN